MSVKMIVSRILIFLPYAIEPIATQSVTHDESSSDLQLPPGEALPVGRYTFPLYSKTTYPQAVVIRLDRVTL